VSKKDPPNTRVPKGGADELSQARRRFEAAMNTIADVFYALDPEWRIVVFNKAAERYFGFAAKDVLDRDLWEVFPQGRGGRYEALCQKAKDGKNSTLVMPSALKPGRLVEITFAPWDDGVCVAITDVTDRQGKEAQVRQLMAEVNHRSKNLLAVVQAVARQTAAKNPKDFVTSFEQRLMALSKAQDLLIKGDWRKVGLEELIRAELEHFAALIGRRIILQGHRIAITPAAAQALGMAFHELATNAAKHGALSNDVGAVTISWEVAKPEGAAEERLTIAWREIGGPSVRDPVSKGFGSSVIGPMVRNGLSAEVDIAFNPEGLLWRMSCEAGDVLAAGEPDHVEHAEPRERPAHSSTRGRILVVEDEPLVGMEIADALTEAGFTVLGPVSSNADALALVAVSGCDGAVLDVNLGRETSEPLAIKFRAEGVPFITLTGYAPDQTPESYQHAPVLTKPILTEILVAELASQIARPSAQ
jgi:PAS domain S-box-containing protein